MFLCAFSLVVDRDIVPEESSPISDTDGGALASSYYQKLRPILFLENWLRSARSRYQNKRNFNRFPDGAALQVGVDDEANVDKQVDARPF